LAGTPTAAAEPSPKALIWAASTEDRALVKRVRGQVSDLDLEVSVVDADVAGADHVSSDPRVFALVWFTRSDPSVDRIVVHATSTRGDAKPEMIREIGAGTPTPSGELQSATLEAAAVVVREVLRELAAKESAAPAPARSVHETAAASTTGRPDDGKIAFCQGPIVAGASAWSAPRKLGLAVSVHCAFSTPNVSTAPNVRP
jgi:hypothetical protein